MLNIIP